jgi:hypothetical protein
VTLAEDGVMAVCTATVMPRSLQRNFADPLKGPVFRLAVYVTVVAVGQGLLSYAVTSDMDVSLIGMVTVFAMCAGIWHWLSQVRPPHFTPPRRLLGGCSGAKSGAVRFRQLVGCPRSDICSEGCAPLIDHGP